MDFIFPRIQDFPEYIQYKFNDLVAAGVDEKAAMIVAARSGKRFDPQFNPGEIFTFEPNDIFGQAYMFLSGQKPKPYTYVRTHSGDIALNRLISDCNIAPDLNVESLLEKYGAAEPLFLSSDHEKAMRQIEVLAKNHTPIVVCNIDDYCDSFSAKNLLLGIMRQA